MHEELAAVLALWNNVSAADRLKVERTSFAERERLAAESLESAQRAREQARATLDEVLGAERQVMRKLDAYRKRIETTRAMIEAGKAPDYRLADQQLRSCIEIADELETQALELMERRDEAEDLLAKAKEALEEAARQRDQLQTRSVARLPAIEAELVILDGARPALEKVLPGPVRAAFNGLRARGRSAVSQLKESSCTACNYSSPQQVVNEIQGDVRIHQCRNCQRFLLPEET